MVWLMVEWPEQGELATHKSWERPLVTSVWSSIDCFLFFQYITFCLNGPMGEPEHASNQDEPADDGYAAQDHPRHDATDGGTQERAEQGTKGKAGEKQAKCSISGIGRAAG